jgi:hypothetical protein
LLKIYSQIPFMITWASLVTPHLNNCIHTERYMYCPILRYLEMLRLLPNSKDCQPVRYCPTLRYCPAINASLIFDWSILMSCWHYTWHEHLRKWFVDDCWQSQALTDWLILHLFWM